jgi:hypothetical protein
MVQCSKKTTEFRLAGAQPAKMHGSHGFSVFFVQQMLRHFLQHRASSAFMVDLQTARITLGLASNRAWPATLSGETPLARFAMS